MCAQVLRLRGWRWLAVLCAVAGLSCSGPSLNKVKGKVLYKGQGIKGAVVVFHAKGADDIKAVRPSGVTGEDGSFALSTNKADGAPAGDYVVTVVWLQQPEAPKQGKIINTEGPPDATDRLEGRYATKAKSALTAQVKSGENNLEPFKIE